MGACAVGMARDRTTRETHGERRPSDQYGEYFALLGGSLQRVAIGVLSVVDLEPNHVLCGVVVAKALASSPLTP